ncbi:DUF7284 family protein [Halorubrum salsamenti]|jgi:hypothetical protein|uniref:DUF7284 family protein n=1 Tax=Halorubrum salsamenti TaxID=2583990 RepID=UPI0011A4D8C3|nr:hypothetical protein [Halorubrum salsamenti]
MTSTVLDVTVLLLCVSASVVALGAADSDRATMGAEAAEVADLIATETVTVTYASGEAPNGTRTVHATRAELLALVAAGGDGEEHAAREAFESEALSAIERGIGPRTRIDAEMETRASDGPANETGGELGSPSSDDTDGSALRGATGTGIPWRIDREDGGSETEGSATESESPGPVVVGSEPPRGADVTVAVITHPAPNDSDATETIRIVIRRW